MKNDVLYANASPSKRLPKGTQLLVTTTLLCSLVIGYSVPLAAQPSNGPMGEVLDALGRIEERVGKIEDKVDDLQTTVFEDVTEFLSFSICFPTSGVLEGGATTGGEISGSAIAGVGAKVFGNGIKTKLDGKILGEWELGLDVESGISTETCIDVLTLAAFLDNQVKSSGISERDALRMAFGPNNI